MPFALRRTTDQTRGQLGLDRPGAQSWVDQEIVRGGTGDTFPSNTPLQLHATGAGSCERMKKVKDAQKDVRRCGAMPGTAEKVKDAPRAEGWRKCEENQRAERREGLHRKSRTRGKTRGDVAQCQRLRRSQRCATRERIKGRSRFVDAAGKQSRSLRSAHWVAASSSSQ